MWENCEKMRQFSSLFTPALSWCTKDRYTSLSLLFDYEITEKEKNKQDIDHLHDPDLLPEEAGWQ